MAGRERYFTDVVAFDPDAIADQATYEDPHQYATELRARARQRVRDGKFAGRHSRCNCAG
jgi:hypothetical protein